MWTSGVDFLSSEPCGRARAFAEQFNLLGLEMTKAPSKALSKMFPEGFVALARAMHPPNVSREFDGRREGEPCVNLKGV